MMLKRGDASLKNGNSEIFDIHVYRVQIEELLYGFGISVHRIEDSRHVHKQHCENAPQVLYVSEKDEQSREDKTHADIENDKAQDGEGKQ